MMTLMSFNYKLISSKYTIRIHQSTMGNLFLERCNSLTNMVYGLFKFMMILWNLIPPEIRNLTSTVTCAEPVPVLFL